MPGSLPFHRSNAYETDLQASAQLCYISNGILDIYDLGSFIFPTFMYVSKFFGPVAHCG